MTNEKILDCICCPKCKSNLVSEGDSFCCSNCRNIHKAVEENIIEMLPKDMPEDAKLSLEKWDKLYKESLLKKTYEAEKREYDKAYLGDVITQISEHYKFRKGDIYLEIGCGPMFLGQEFAGRGLNVIGVDFSLSALRIAKKMLEDRGVDDYLLIHSDIKGMPLRENTVDVMYGGGVIEHFKNTKGIVTEMHRVLKKGGICFNTVPQLNIGSLTYRQLWGNIPNFPILKPFAEIIHIRLLGGKHMRFGYEFSFTKRGIKRIFGEQNFSKKVVVDDFRCYLPFEYLKPMWAKKIARRISKFGMFNPMILVIAQK